MEATEDRDCATLAPYLPHLLHIVQLHCNGIDPEDYIAIHELLWVHSVDVKNIINTLVVSIGHYIGLGKQVNIGLIHDTHDFLVECR